MRSQLVFWALVGWLVTGSVQAQDARLEEVLVEASNAFSIGHYYAVPSLLKEELVKGGSRDQQRRAFALLAQAYLVLDRPDLADSSYLRLLRADPEFIPSIEQDPIDIVYLSKKFTTRPIFTPHVRLLFPVSWTTELASLTTSPLELNRSYALRPGFSFGGGLDWNVSDRISLGTEVNFSLRSYRKTITGIAQNDELEVIDRQTWLDFPIYLKYSHGTGQWRPFVYAGGALNLHLGSQGTLLFVNRSPQRGVESREEGANISLTGSRYRLGRSLVFGAGVKYKAGKNFLFADVRFMPGLQNITRETGIWYRDAGRGEFQLVSEASQYQYLFGFFRMNSVAISVGYIMPIYTPRYVKKANTRKVQRSVTKQQEP